LVLEEAERLWALVYVPDRGVGARDESGNVIVVIGKAVVDVESRPPVRAKMRVKACILGLARDFLRAAW
jgi:hypothetical protein